MVTEDEHADLEWLETHVEPANELLLKWKSTFN